VRAHALCEGASSRVSGRAGAYIYLKAPSGRFI
jgi:hypothetical protein